MSREEQVRVRVAACICEDGEVLLVQHEKHGARYWLLPGGGVEHGETLLAATAREVEEETGYAAVIGRLFLVCEAIETAGRHIVNLFFAAQRTGGELRVGRDRSLRDVRWHPIEQLGQLVVVPPVVKELQASWREGFDGPVRVLGNVWRPLDARAGDARATD